MFVRKTGVGWPPALLSTAPGAPADGGVGALAFVANGHADEANSHLVRKQLAVGVDVYDGGGGMEEAGKIVASLKNLPSELQLERAACILG